VREKVTPAVSQGISKCKG